MQNVSHRPPNLQQLVHRTPHTGLSAGTITLGEVTTLDHELLDDAVEGRPLISETLLASGKSTEVLSRLGNGLAVETHDNAAQGLIAVGNVEVHLVGDLRSLGSFSTGGEEDQADAQEERRRHEETSEVEHCNCFRWDMQAMSWILEEGKDDLEHKAARSMPLVAAGRSYVSTWPLDSQLGLGRRSLTPTTVGAVVG